MPGAFTVDEATGGETATPTHPASQVETSGHHLEHSDAHFQSEQNLFVHTPSSPDSGHDFIDVASFLEMGHVPHCWCKPCQDMYEHDLDEDSPDAMGTTDDEWMVCSTASGTRSPSSCSAWEWEWGTLVEGESDFVDEADSAKWESDDAWRCTSPSAKAHRAW